MGLLPRCFQLSFWSRWMKRPLTQLVCLSQAFKTRFGAWSGWVFLFEWCTRCSRWTLITDHLQKWCFNDTMASPQAGHVGNSVDVMNAWLLHWHPFTLSILIPLSCPPWSLETSWNCLKIFLGTMYMYVAAIHSIYSHFSFLYHQNLVHRHHPLPSRATRIFDSNCFSHSRSSSKLLYLALARVNHSCRWGRMSRGSLLDGLVLFLQAL